MNNHKLHLVQTSHYRQSRHLALRHLPPSATLYPSYIKYQTDLLYCPLSMHEFSREKCSKNFQKLIKKLIIDCDMTDGDDLSKYYGLTNLKEVQLKLGDDFSPIFAYKFLKRVRRTIEQVTFSTSNMKRVFAILAGVVNSSSIKMIEFTGKEVSQSLQGLFDRFLAKKNFKKGVKISVTDINSLSNKKVSPFMKSLSHMNCNLTVFGAFYVLGKWENIRSLSLKYNMLKTGFDHVPFDNFLNLKTANIDINPFKTAQAISFDKFITGWKFPQTLESLSISIPPYEFIPSNNSVTSQEYLQFKNLKEFCLRIKSGNLYFSMQAVHSEIVKTLKNFPEGLKELSIFNEMTVYNQQLRSINPEWQ